MKNVWNTRNTFIFRKQKKIIIREWRDNISLQFYRTFIFKGIYFLRTIGHNNRSNYMEIYIENQLCLYYYSMAIQYVKPFCYRTSSGSLSSLCAFCHFYKYQMARFVKLFYKEESWSIFVLINFLKLKFDFYFCDLCFLKQGF